MIAQKRLSYYFICPFYRKFVSAISEIWKSVSWLSLSASILLFFSSCNDCEDTEPILLYASTELKAVGVFKPGTFWVYQDDSTLNRDSVVVTSYEYVMDTITEPCQDNNMKVVSYKETFYTYTKSVIVDIDYLWKVQVGLPLLVSKENLLADTIFVDSPCIDTTFCNTIDTLIVSGIKYPGVYVRIDPSSSLHEGKPVHIYSALKFGIIKTEILEADSSITSWSLINSNIVQ